MTDLSTIQNVANMTSFVADHQGGLIYITTSTGLLLRWDVGAGAFLAPITLGGNLSSIDISTDDSFLLVGRSNLVNSTTVIDRVSTQTLSVTPLALTLGYDEGGVTDIALAADNTALVTTRFLGSGRNPFHTFDATQPAIGTATVAGLSMVSGVSWALPAADDRYIFVLEGDASSAPMHIYSAAEDRVTASTSFYALGSYGFNIGKADINDSVGLVADLTYNNIFVLNFSLGLVADLSRLQNSGSLVGLQFTQSGHHLLLWDSVSDRLKIFDTGSWSQVGTVSLSSDVSTLFNNSPRGEMDLSPDGRMLLLNTGTGFELVDLAAKLALTLTGDDAANLLNGDVGNDTISGGAGNDIINGGGGTDILDGGTGSDTAVFAEARSHYVLSDGGKGDYIVAHRDGVGEYDYAVKLLNMEFIQFGDQTLDLATVGPAELSPLPASALTYITNFGKLVGTSGADDLRGNGGADRIFADLGDDRLRGEGGDDLLDGGGGADTAVFTGVSYSYVVSALGNGAFGVADQVAWRDGTDTLSNVEFLKFADHTYDLATVAVAAGTDQADTLHAGLSVDFIYGGGGDDFIDGGTPDAADRIDAGAGADTVSYASSTSGIVFAGVFPAGSGFVPVWAASRYDVTQPAYGPYFSSESQFLLNVERVDGSEFNDLIFGGGSIVQLYGGAGDDDLRGQGRFYGGDGADSLQGGLTADQLYGGAGDDILGGGGDFFYSYGPISQNDQLYGGEGSDRLQGGVGDDQLDGGSGDDTADYTGFWTLQVSYGDYTGVTVDLRITGPQQVGFNFDTLISIENLIGSSLNDRLIGDGGDNVIEGRAGDDSLDGGAGVDTASYASAYNAVTVSLALTGAQDTVGAGRDTLVGFENLTGSAYDDQLFGDGGANLLSGGDGADTLTGGAGNDILNGGSNIDIAVFSGAMSAYTLTTTSTGLSVTGPDGTDTLTNIEYLQFSDQTFHYRPGSGATVDFTAYPSTYAGALRDFDGNDLGGAGSWILAGHVDVQGDGDQEYILFNAAIGRWATIGPAADGKVYFDDHGWAGDTRVVGIYIDPQVQADPTLLGGPFDSQRRFQNDLNIGNIKGILGAADYNHDGLQEIYFSLTDGTAYLHAYMHADGNIQYANYQSQQQVTDYLTANGFAASTWSGWF